jgi:REP element-mobilizing transposase RayT
MCVSDNEPRASARAVSEAALAVHLLTWTTYGTWLPGDERGFVSRVPDEQGNHTLPNQFNTPRPQGSSSLDASARQRMKGSTVTLTPEQAALVARVIEESAERHAIRLMIGAVMHTHVHVITESKSPGGSEQMRLFKGASSRVLTLTFGEPSGRWWTKSGSVKLKFDDTEKRRALEYVLRHEALAWCGIRARDLRGDV